MNSQLFDYFPILNSLLAYSPILLLASAGLFLLLLVVFIRNVFYYWTTAIRSASQQAGTGSGGDDSIDWDWFGPNKAKSQYQECLVNSPENTGELKKLLRERALETVRQYVKWKRRRKHLESCTRMALSVKQCGKA